MGNKQLCCKYIDKDVHAQEFGGKKPGQEGADEKKKSQKEAAEQIIKNLKFSDDQAKTFEK